MTGSRSRAGVLAMMLLCVPGFATAQTPATACTSATPLPPELAAWNKPVALAAGATADTASLLTSGVAATVTLHPASHLRYAHSPEKPGAADSHGGLLSFEVPQAGTWRIALATAAWIDVLANGEPVASTAHGHGPACSGIRKMVDFQLQPGRHLLQITGSAAATQTVLVVQVP